MQIIKIETRRNMNTYEPEVAFMGVMAIDDFTAMKHAAEKIDDSLYREIGKGLVDQITELMEK